MTRKQFIQWFCDRREAHYKKQVKAGEMRPSEAAMGMTSAPDEAKKLWRTLDNEERAMLVQNPAQFTP